MKLSHWPLLYRMLLISTNPQHTSFKLSLYIEFLKYLRCTRIFSTLYKLFMWPISMFIIKQHSVKKFILNFILISSIQYLFINFGFQLYSGSISSFHSTFKSFRNFLSPGKRVSPFGKRYRCRRNKWFIVCFPHMKTRYIYISCTI